MDTVSVVATVAGCITGAAAAIVIIWRICMWFHWIVEGLRCQLRTDMTKTYYTHRTEKTIREYEYAAFMLNYKAYKMLHGNSFIEKLKLEVENWEIVA